MSAALRQIAPAPRRPLPGHQPRVTFYDLPAELRIEIYKLALEGVVIHVLPLNTVEERKIPHPLTRASRQVRNEVLPMIHSMCPIRCSITDFCFDGLLAWMHRIPPDEQSKLLKNENLRIHFHTTGNNAPRGLDSLRKWLHDRADPCRPQPKWSYQGATPPSKICADLRRRAKRMRESGKQAELYAILKALSIPCTPEREARVRTANTS
ncbi:Hypothetical predicted protein [Lecanosticta acicola]|uniref:Uncharacterized protein n=1 Tax=Lecanosticta acicola TaxID=111012 RepID=A0AAI8W179_9PEZI|nr:Hypothetical predicted protein [Lecanosticta acicola]